MPRVFAANQRLNVPVSASLLLKNRTTFSLMLWFKAASSATFRHFYTEYAVFNDQLFVRLNNAGKADTQARSPTLGDNAITSASAYDDNAWHRLLYVRSATASSALYVDDVSVGSDVTNDAGTSSASIAGGGSAIGNWTAAANTDSTGDGPFLGSIFRLIALTQAVTAGEARSILYTGQTRRSRIFHYELLGQYPEPSLAGLPGGVGLAQSITAGSQPGVSTSLPPGVTLH